MGKCHSCGNYNCHWNCGCNSCITQTKDYCVFYTGENLTCLDITKGDTLKEILVSLNDIVCGIVPPSGLTTSVNSCSSGITVSSSNVSGVTTYTVCLNPDITANIATNTSNISTIQGCINNTVKNITSSTLDISVDSTNSCGRTLRLEVASPSGMPVYDGIIENLGITYSSSGTGTQILYAFSHDYEVGNNISDGDEIRFAFEGAITATSATPGSVTFEIFDSNSAIVLYGFTESSFPTSAAPYGYEISGSIRRISSTLSTVSAKLNTSAPTNGTYGSFYTPEKGVIRKTIASMDYSNLTLRIKVNITGTSTITSDTQMVEVRKKI